MPSGTDVDIVPAGRWPGVGLAELWDYRELLLFLVWRDVKVRYAQTVVGAGWTVLQPIVTMVVFTAVFGRLVKVPSDGVPYSVFSLAALIPWTYFSNATTAAGNSLVSNTNLITKVYFPRLVIPFASLFVGLINLAITLGILFLMLIVFGLVPRATALVVLPLLLVIMMLTAGGVGCWLAALAIQYRDIRNLSVFLVQVWMFASPVVYPLSLVPDAYRPFYLLNPIAGVVEGFRSVLLGTVPLPVGAIAAAWVVSLLLFVTGVLYFRRMEHTFADVA